MTAIIDIHAREILDSRGNPTVEVDVLLEDGFTLSDATAYNVQFEGTRPVFIDHLSVVPYEEGALWNGQRQFAMQFLNPLLLAAYFGVPFNGWLRGSPEGLPSAAISRLLPWRRKWRVNLRKTSLGSVCGGDRTARSGGSLARRK